jgi:uncharacterized membrane protein YhaH (DUF805 family)
METDQHATLKAYIKAQRSSGVSDEAIYEDLLSSGWQPNVIHDMLGITRKPAPVPAGTPAYSADYSDPTTPQIGGLFKGRLGRLAFFVAGLYITGAVAVLAIAIILLAAALNNPIVSFFALLLGGLLVIAAIALSISIHVRRWHDLDQPGLLVLLGFIPIVGLIVTIILLFISGTQGANRYGPPASPALSPKSVFNFVR